MIFNGSGCNTSARFFGILPPRNWQIFTSERLPHTMQTSCGLSLTTSQSAHSTAHCSATAFKGRRDASRLPPFGWFITGPWEEVHRSSILPRLLVCGNGSSGSFLCVRQTKFLFLRYGIPNSRRLNDLWSWVLSEMAWLQQLASEAGPPSTTQREVFSRSIALNRFNGYCAESFTSRFSGLEILGNEWNCFGSPDLIERCLAINKIIRIACCFEDMQNHFFNFGGFCAFERLNCGRLWMYSWIAIRS